MATGLVLSQVIPETLVHIVEPVAGQVLNYIIGKLGYADLFGSQVELTSETRTTSKTTDKNHNPLLRPNRVRGILSPNVNPFNLKWEGQHTGHVLGAANTVPANPSGANGGARVPWTNGAFGERNHTVMDDQKYGISLSEYIIGSALSMSVEMDFADMVVAVEALQRLYQYFTNGQMINYIDIQYDYPIPSGIQLVLRHLYTLRGQQDGDEDQTCMHWCRRYSAGAISVLTNRNRQKVAEAVVNKNHFQAMFEIECTMDAPEHLDPDFGRITFNVNVQYARVNMLILNYPVIVNNKYVDFKYIPMSHTYRQGGSSPIFWQNKAVSDYWQKLYAKTRVWRPIHYPWCDPWQLPDSSIIARNFYKPIYICAITLDDAENSEGVTQVDLINGLPGTTLNEAVIKCLREKKEECLDTQSEVNVAVFADDYQVEYRRMGGRSPLVEFDGQTLTLKSRRKYSIFRIVVSVRTRDFVKNPRSNLSSMHAGEMLDDESGVNTIDALHDPLTTNARRE